MAGESTSRRVARRRSTSATAQEDSHVSASERVYRGIKEAILSGELPPGSRLVELALARAKSVE